MSNKFKKFAIDFLKQNKNSNLQQNKEITNLTSFKIMCFAKVFVDVKCLDDLHLLFRLAQKHKVQTFCLGGGSKILFANKKVPYVVYTLSGVFNKIGIVKDRLIVGAGVHMSVLCQFCNKYNLSCVEWGLGVPCKIGGGVFMNAGCYGKSFADIVDSVICSDGQKIYKLSNKECEFAYRKSAFQKNKLIILFVYLKFFKSAQKIREQTQKFFIKKTSSQPYNYPSVGSIFKSSTLPAPLYIEKHCFKGFAIGDAEVSKKHCGFIINKKNATPRQVLKIICKIKKTVWKKDAILLYNEVLLIGEKRHGIFW